MKGTRPLTGPALTYDLCGQYVKVNVNGKINPSLSYNVKRPARGFCLGARGLAVSAV